MAQITFRYAQEKGGQKLHIVPEIGSYQMVNEALCGKQVSRWRSTFNVPLGHCCKNCMRVDRLNGKSRAKQLVLAALESA